MTEVFWTAVLATLISPPILLSHSLFPVVLLNGREMILLVYPPAFSIHLSNDRKYQIALSFSASGSYLYKCCERKETIAYSVRSSGGWHADNRFCCGVIAARWGVSLPNRGLLARRRHLTVPSMNKWDSSPWWMWTTGGSIESQLFFSVVWPFPFLRSVLPRWCWQGSRRWTEAD